MQATEWWLPVVGLEDRYLVSSWGNVWSLRSDRMMCQCLQRKSGYMTVMLWAGSRATYRTRKVHQLVLRAFEGECPPGLMTRHLNGDRTDNRWLDNLVYGTNAENQADRILHGTSNRGERHGNHRLTEQQVLEIYARRAERGLAGEFGVSVETISAIRTGRAWGWLTGAAA